MRHKDTACVVELLALCCEKTATTTKQLTCLSAKRSLLKSNMPARSFVGGYLNHIKPYMSTIYSVLTIQIQTSIRESCIFPCK